MIKEDDMENIVEFDNDVNNEFRELVTYCFANNKTTQLINIIYKNQPISVGDIVQLSDYSGSNVSQSLAKLSELKIVGSSRSGNSKGFFIKDKNLLEILLVRDVFAALRKKPASLEENQEVVQKIADIVVPYIKNTDWR